MARKSIWHGENVVGGIFLIRHGRKFVSPGVGYDAIRKEAHLFTREQGPLDGGAGTDLKFLSGNISVLSLWR